MHVLTPENILARPVDPVQIGMLRGLDGEKLNYGLDLVVKYIKTTAEDDVINFTLTYTNNTIIK